jgi:hypothetical protein
VSLSTALPCCSGGGEAISAACVVKTKISLYSLHLYSDRSEREGEKDRKFMVQKKILYHY